MTWRDHPTWDEVHQDRKREAVERRFRSGFAEFVEFWLTRTLPDFPTPGDRSRAVSAVLMTFGFDAHRARAYLRQEPGSKDLVDWLWYTDGTYRTDVFVRVNVGFALLLPSLVRARPEDTRTREWLNLLLPSLPGAAQGGIPDKAAWEYPVPLEHIPFLAENSSVDYLEKFAREGKPYPAAEVLGFVRDGIPLEYALSMLDIEVATP